MNEYLEKERAKSPWQVTVAFVTLGHLGNLFNHESTLATYVEAIEAVGKKSPFINFLRCENESSRGKVSNSRLGFNQYFLSIGPSIALNIPHTAFVTQESSCNTRKTLWNLVQDYRDTFINQGRKLNGRI